MSRTPPQPTPAAPAGPAADPSSRGSVLIFVIGVLLLLAIVATAFLGTSRADRTATQQNAFNTQVDLLMEGVANAAKGQIVGDDTVPGGITPDLTDANTFESTLFGGPAGTAVKDTWLASRVPTTLDRNLSLASSGPENVLSQIPLSGTLPNSGVANPNAVWWPAVSNWVLGSSFESPLTPYDSINTKFLTTAVPTYTARNYVAPTYVHFGGQTWPALQVTSAFNVSPVTYLAADADGDGVADSGLFRIPVGDLAGLTYYGAVRIVDNNAAVNVNTAQSADYEFRGNGQGGLLTAGVSPDAFQLAGVFPSSIGLAEMLHTTLAATAKANMPAAPATTPYFDHMKGVGATINEFTLLNHYRLGATQVGKRADGVFGGVASGSTLTPYDDTTINDGSNSATPVGFRPDFQYATMGEELTRVLADRLSNPGYSRFTSGEIARSSVVDGINLASRFSLATAGISYTATAVVYPSNLTQAIAPSLMYGVESPTATQPRSQPYIGNSDSGIDTWFGTNFNYLAEDVSNPVGTFMNRQTILTTTNGVSDQATTGVLPPAWLYSAGDPEWSTGGTVQHAQGFFNPFVPYNTSGSTTAIPTLPMAVASITGATAGAITVDPKVSINTGRFEELFYGFFRVMAQPGFTGNGDDAGTPFSAIYNLCKEARSVTTYNALAPILQYSGDSLLAGNRQFYSDPYLGMRFPTPLILADEAGVLANRLEQSIEYLDDTGTKKTASLSLLNGETNTAEQHPLRMFRSVLRAAHDRTDPASPNIVRKPTDKDGNGAQYGYWNAFTPRLPADQVLLLRAAIAAANVEALRDSSNNPLITFAGGATPMAANERVVAHKIPLTAVVNGVNTPVVANIFGLRRQVFISEVYANSSINGDTVSGTGNPSGYVAIKLFNPNPYAISLRNCRLVGLRRFEDATTPQIGTPPVTVSKTLPHYPEQYPNMTVRDLATPLSAPTTLATDQISLATATSNVTGGTLLPFVVPANGTLVLENVNGTTGTAPLVDDANHRPQSSLLALNGKLTVPATVNVAYVPGLTRVCWDRELVLMRPTDCTPPLAAGTPANAIEYIWPDNVADTATTTGHANIDPRVGTGTDAMAPLDSYDFTGLAPNLTPTTLSSALGLPARTRAEIWSYKRAVNTAGTPDNRWQWVYPGRYDGDQSIVAALTTNPAPRQQGTYRAFGSDNAPGMLPTDQDRFDPADPKPGAVAPINGGVTLASDPATVISVPNFPDRFTIQLNTQDMPGDQPLHDYTTASGLASPQPNRFPFGGFRRVGDVLDAPFIGSYTIQTEVAAAAGTTTFLEVNPVTMDAALAEDTDVADNELGTDTGVQSREQVGRFVPLRPSHGTAANGQPAVFTADTVVPGATPPVYSVSYDPAMDDRTAVSTTPDPLRYRDDAGYVDLPVLPNMTNATDRAIHAQATRYQFANKLFDYFTVDALNDDNVPNYPTQPKWQPATYYSVGDTVQFGQHVFTRIATGLSTATDAPANAELNTGGPAMASNNYLPTAPAVSANWVVLPRFPLANANLHPGSRSDTWAAQTSKDYYTADDSGETSQSKPGLININTAPERVLAAVPWSPRSGTGATGDNLTIRFDVSAAYAPTVVAGGDGIDDNAQIAHLIVLYRDGNYVTSGLATPGNYNNLGMTSTTNRPFLAHALSPFVSSFDLYKVPGFREAQAAVLTNIARPADVSVLQGDYAPASVAGVTAPDGVRFDFEEQTLFMNRVSNLITTHSDSYTLYALVQGWRNVGTANPQLVVQRRAAFIIDRSGAKKTSQTISSTRVPVN